MIIKLLNIRILDFVTLLPIKGIGNLVEKDSQSCESKGPPGNFSLCIRRVGNENGAGEQVDGKADGRDGARGNVRRNEGR